MNKRYDPIIFPLAQLIDLLGRYQGNNETIEKLNDVLNELESKAAYQRDLALTLKELDHSLFGMGSITDGAFVPRFDDDGETSKEYGKVRCDEICEELRVAIRKEIEATKGAL